MHRRKAFAWNPNTAEHVQEEKQGAMYTSLLAWPCAVFFGGLAIWKFRLGKQLNSQVLRKDALCSLLGAALSLICALAAALELLATNSPISVEAIDVCAGATIALILLVEGARTLRHNLPEGSWRGQHTELA
ncbi:unnamed protein product [Polarella glacialis]|uniref:Transmembrane protein 163 n=1 Tax=Polarella glacialis TaxID=89957 RepID=A0A813LH61_POLGL|nr:unnamed protein product [Polarella glacialis]